jgi:hypothetical protein
MRWDVNFGAAPGIRVNLRLRGNMTGATRGLRANAAFNPQSLLPLVTFDSKYF